MRKGGENKPVIYTTLIAHSCPNLLSDMAVWCSDNTSELGSEIRGLTPFTAAMIEIDHIYNCDCVWGLKEIPDHLVDLVVIDPPYELQQHGEKVGSAFGRSNRQYHQDIDHLQSGISGNVLQEFLRVSKHPNMYVFCSKDQLPQLLNFALGNKLSYDLLTWHKTNPTPTCNNKYLSDTEYIVFMRKGANLYGTYETKRKYFLTKTNVTDKKLWRHPTPKPVSIIKTLIENSTKEGDIVLDCFMGSGTTAIACAESRRHYIGFEIDKDYYDKSLERLRMVKQQYTLGI